MNASTRTLLLLICLTLSACLALVWNPGVAAPPAPTEPIPSNGSDRRTDEAERLYREGSYAMAREAYLALSSEADPRDRDWIEFRLADTAWRAQAASKTADTTVLDRARQALERRVRDVERIEDRDRVWAEAQESLGDFWWTRAAVRNWGQGWNHYRLALEYWSASRDLDLARERYLGIAWRAARPPQEASPYYYYGYYGNHLPLDVLENVRDIAIAPADLAYAHYLLAMTRRGPSADVGTHRRIHSSFEAAIEPGPGHDWYDDALYRYAEWCASSGRIERDENGNYSVRPDYPRALELFRRVVSEFDRGRSRFHDDAERQIETITGPSVGLAVGHTFLPGSEIAFGFSWRNVGQAEFTLYAVDLTSDIDAPEQDAGLNWVDWILTPSSGRVRSWVHRTADRGGHLPGNETITLERPLTAGAYILEVSGEGKRARELLMVTGSAGVLKASDREARVFVCDAGSGAPRPGARVTLWVREDHGRTQTVQPLHARTGEDGLARFDLPRDRNSLWLLATASEGQDQAFAASRRPYRRQQQDLPWKLYLFADRPAYRPGETAQWKLIARQLDSGVYVTPADQELDFVIRDPRGAEVSRGSARLGAFGSSWDSMDLDANLPLGPYNISFTHRGRGIGGATLFRLEEYKLPEFKVRVDTPQDGARARTFRPGESVELDVVAEYYFGGPVAHAGVEVVVSQRPTHIFWSPERKFPWYFENPQQGRGWFGSGNVVHRATLNTDAGGRARVVFDVPDNSRQDFEYVVKARVTDASRREIVGSGSVRVGRQGYYAFFDLDHVLYRPGDQVRLKLKTIDANRQPVEREGLVRVTRQRWLEVWTDRSGREYTGGALERVRSEGKKRLTPVSQGYETEEVLTRSVRTDAEGQAEIAFVLDRSAFYKIEWIAEDRDRLPVRAETSVWVADAGTDDVGYHHGGVQIIVDRDTFRSGAPSVVMLSVPAPDAWVLFSVQGDGIYDLRLVHVRGTAKLVELTVDERYTPNVFLEAVMVRDGKIHIDSRQVVVPPVDRFLDVAVEIDRDVFRPRETGTLRVVARDHLGRPVQAEVALSLVDESVFYIQQDYAGDPRSFFFGTKRSNRVVTASSFQGKPYASLNKDELAELQDPRRPGGPLPTSAAAPRVMGAQRKSSIESMDADLSFAGNRSESEARFDEVAAEGSAAAPGQAAVQVRSDFRTTALWLPDLVTGPDGTAEADVVFPDNVTGWIATARAATEGSRFGFGEAAVRTHQPLVVRLQAPRFFVSGDRATVSAVIHNDSDSALNVSTDIELEGLRRLDSAAPTPNGLRIEAGSELRVDWQVAAVQAGPARIRVTARGGDLSDAMERNYTVHEHGVEKFARRSGKLDGSEIRVGLDLPRERRERSALLGVQVSASAAVTMLDALPYLIDYPYGCTEQTLSRFLPSVITLKALEDLGLDRELVARRIFGGIETQYASATHPAGRRELDRLDEMVHGGLHRLYDFQHADGGWSWWKEGDSDPFMTSYVVWGLGLARQAGVHVRSNVIERGASHLETALVEYEQRLDLQAWMLHALAGSRKGRGDMSEFERAAMDNLWTRRDALGAYARALLALSADAYGQDDRAHTLVRNLVNGVQWDRAPDRSVLIAGSGAGSSDRATAHWGNDGIFYRWSEGGVEASAFALRALLAIEPDHELVEPVTRWLIGNRRGAQWSNTRDTSITVLTLVDYLRQSGELETDLEYEVEVNGQHVVTNRITPDSVLTAPSLVSVNPDLLVDGRNHVRIVRRQGRGPLYFSAELRYFSLEEPIRAEGSEIFVRRRYFERVPYPTLLDGFRLENRPFGDESRVGAGRRIEVVLTVEAKNHFEYMIFEDLKPAGFEAVQLRSGTPMQIRELRSDAVSRDPASREAADYTGRSYRVHQELRDRKVALFVDRLPQGVWELRYELRAETPGSFHALPVMAHAMYVPEIRGNGDEVRVEVVE